MNLLILLSSDKLGSFNNTEEKKHCKVRVLILYCKIFCILKYVYFSLFIELAEAIHQTRTSQ